MIAQRHQLRPDNTRRNCGLRIADRRLLRARSPFRDPKSEIRNRLGFTLVELMITIMIIGILASLALGVATMAGQTAREAKTRMMIERIHTLLTEQYDRYKVRRIDTSVLDKMITDSGGTLTPEVRADNRLLALRQLMRLEMPDRWSDLLNDSVVNLRPENLTDTMVHNLRTNDDGRFLYVPGRSDLWSSYIRRYRQMGNRENTITGEENTPEDVVANQSAECLYLIVMLATGDGEARSQFNDNEIGDTDGDGAPEFLDGWGNPIGFLRWAPGFSSSLQLGPGRLAQIRADAEALRTKYPDIDPNQEVTSAVAGDHDPFDMFHRDAYGTSGYNSTIYLYLRDNRYSYRLVPLVYSAGRDGVADIFVGPDLAAIPNVAQAAALCDPYNYNPAFEFWLRGTPVTLLADGSPATTPPPSGGQLNLPRIDGSTTVTYYIDADANGATDNIHNHLIGQR